MAVSSCVSVAKIPPLRMNSSSERGLTKWDEMIKWQTKLKSDEGILLAYREMEVLGLVPDQRTLPLVLKACGRLKAVEKGIKIHEDILDSGMMMNVRVGTALVDFYCKCGLVEDAYKVFDEMHERDVVAWNAMVSGYVGMGLHAEAIKLATEMGRSGLSCNSGTVVALLVAAGEMECFSKGREVHGYCLRNGLVDDDDARVGTGLVGFYAKCDASVASLVFESLVLRNFVSWNVMLRGYFDAGNYLKTVKLFESMLVDGIGFDAKTLLVVVQACDELGSLRLGAQIHQLLIKSEFVNDVYIINALMNMYSNNACFECLSRLFERVFSPDAAMWNSKILACIKYGYYEQAMSFFTKMRTERRNVDGRTVIIMLSMCVELDEGLRVGRSLHALVVKTKMRIDAAVGNALLSMYVEMNHIEGVKVFNQIESKDIISWNSYILALARNELMHGAWEQFRRMRTCSAIKPNLHSVIAILSSCANSDFLNAGRSLHGFALKHGFDVNASLSTAVTDMYMNCGDETSARKIFDEFSEKDVVSWNALIAGYIKNNQAHKALLVFSIMRIETEPNSITLLNLLSVCTDLANIQMGQCLHANLLRREYFSCSNVPLANALITMYARCGCMQSAESIFRNQRRRDVISWNAIIAGYGSHGHTDDAMRSFKCMLEEGFKPTSVTFISLLSACSHSGLVELGMDLYHSMIDDFNLTPELNHYGCVVDLLGRAGRLDKAKEFIHSMPITPDASIWRALLSTCRNHPDINFAKSVFDKIIELEPTNAGNYVLLANIFAASGQWSEVEELWNLLKENNLTKPPGISWIVVKGHVHSFTAGDEAHHQFDLDLAEMNLFSSSMNQYGYSHEFYTVEGNVITEQHS